MLNVNVLLAHECSAQATPVLARAAREVLRSSTSTGRARAPLECAKGVGLRALTALLEQVED